MERPSGPGWAWLVGGGLGFVGSVATSLSLGAPDIDALRHDPAEYVRLAFALLEQGGLLTPSGAQEVVRTPGYPAFLAVHFALFGPRLLPIWVSHGLLHAGAVLVVLNLARSLGFDRAWRVGITAAFALYPYALHGAARVLTEPLTTLLVLSGTLLLVRPPSADSARSTSARVTGRALAAGALGGLAALVRPSFSLLPLLWTAALLWRGERRSAAFVLAGALVLMLPWSLRTSMAVGAPAGLTAGGVGHNLHIAAFEYRDLSNGLPPTTDYQGPSFQRSDARARAQVQVPRSKAAYQRALDQARLGRALHQIQEHPGLYARSTLIRVVKLWVSQSAAGLPAWAGRLSAVACLLLLGLGAAGACSVWPWSRGWTFVFLLPLYLVAIHAPLHAEARYTLPARACLLLSAGALLQRGIRSMRKA